jgi:hypothetical protein
MESAAEPINAARCGIVVARGNCAGDPDRAISLTKATTINSEEEQ